VSCGTSPAELYFFLINADGHYAIVRDDAEAGRAELLASGSRSIAIRSIGERNRITAECAGGEGDALLTITVNGQKVGEARGQVGETFDRAAFVVTTPRAIANSTNAVLPGGSSEDPASWTTHKAEVLFDNFISRR
jgi:hypothetical protein